MNVQVIKSFKGGFSDWEDTGVYGAFKYGRNLDIRKLTDSLTCQYGLEDDKAVGTFNGLVLWIVNCSDGNSYHFLETGRIYKRTSGGVYSLVYTDPDGRICGAAEWSNSNGNKFLYWATQTKLHRKEVPGLSDWSDVDSTVNGQSYPKNNLTAHDWHPMKQISGGLYIGNANTLAFVAFDDSYTNNALQLVPGNNARCLLEYNSYALIGCSKDDVSLNSEFFAWDTAQSLNWNIRKTIAGVPINSMINAEFPLMQVGADGQVLLADPGSYNMPIFSFPSGGQVYPDAVELYKGMALFGVFDNGTGKTGIYSYGRVKKNADLVLNLDYQFDCDIISSIKFVGNTLLIAYYKAGLGYGVKKVSTTNREVAVYQSIDQIAPVTTDREPVWARARLVMAPLPAGCSITFWRKMDKSGEFTQCNLESGGTVFSTEGSKEAWFLIGDTGKISEVQAILTPSGISTPEIYRIELFFD